MATPNIPYFSTSRYRVVTMVKLVKPVMNDIGADLGSGDGRITIALAKAGVTMHGYELDVKLINYSEELIKKEKIENIVIYKKDFWLEDLSKYSIICCYPMPTIMKKLEKKLLNELKPGSRVAINYFPFPNWKPKKIQDKIYLYLT